MSQMPRAPHAPPVSRPPSELERLEMVLQQLIVEHRKLLGHLEAQQAAMKAMDLDAMDAAANLQEASRLRIAGLEVKRRELVQQLQECVFQGTQLIPGGIRDRRHRRPGLLFQQMEQVFRRGLQGREDVCYGHAEGEALRTIDVEI